jgi:type I restriction enzyme R subunit
VLRPSTGATNANLGLYPADLIAFLRDTQGHAWDQLVDLAGSEQNARTSALRRVAAQLDKRGTIEVLRRGLTEKGVALRLAYFEPDLEVEPTARPLYDDNRLRSQDR